MIKCGECIRHDNCWLYDEHKDDNGTCIWAETKSITESSNDVIESQNDVIKKPRTVRYKLHKPIEYVSIEFDEEETATDIAHYIELVHCKDCKHLEVINTENTYAICHEHDIIFEPFEDSTKTNFCSWGERREPLPQYEEWQDKFNKMCESATPKTFVADEWYRENFMEEEK